MCLRKTRQTFPSFKRVFEDAQTAHTNLSKSQLDTSKRSKRSKSWPRRMNMRSDRRANLNTFTWQTLSRAQSGSSVEQTVKTDAHTEVWEPLIAARRQFQIWWCLNHISFIWDLNACNYLYFDVYLIDAYESRSKWLKTILVFVAGFLCHRCAWNTVKGYGPPKANIDNRNYVLRSKGFWQELTRVYCI
jgi:hypothetical protein